MQFYDIWTSYNVIGKKLYGRDWKRYYQDAIFKKKPIEELDKGRFHREALSIEYAWIEAHKPYYQIWPGVADEFIKTRIDIDCSLLKSPHQVFAIKMPILDAPILSFKYQDKTSIVESMVITHIPPNIMIWRITFRVEDIDNPGSAAFSLHLKDGLTIEECIGEFSEFYAKDTEDKPFTIPASIQDACLRLIVGVHFLATGSHKILEYDVLSKHLAAYRELEKESPKRKEYENRAKKKGKFGWNIGSGRGERGLKLPRGLSYADAVKAAGGRELLYQHLRGGHWHTVRFGRGREKIKIVWFDETTVRGDLPPKPL